jgi:hypothetical protein
MFRASMKVVGAAKLVRVHAKFASDGPQVIVAKARWVKTNTGGAFYTCLHFEIRTLLRRPSSKCSVIYTRKRKKRANPMKKVRTVAFLSIRSPNFLGFMGVCIHWLVKPEACRPAKVTISGSERAELYNWSEVLSSVFQKLENPKPENVMVNA